MADEDDIIIRAILEDELSDPAERVQRALDELGRANREAADDTRNLSDRQNENTTEQERNRRETDRNTDSRRDNSRETETNTENTDQNTDSTRRNTRERSRNTKSAKDSGKVFGKLAKLMMPIGKAAFLFDALAMSGPAIGALGAGGVAAASGLSVMTGALLPLPALMLGAGQAMGVFKLATSGMGDAVKALATGDFAKFAEATKDFHPAAISTAKAVGEMGQEFKNFKYEIQGAVFAGLEGRLTKLGGSVIPMVRKSFMGTARGINEAAKELLDFLNSGKGLKQLRTILDGTSEISRDFAKGMSAAGKGAVGMFSAVMPVARQMSKDLLDGVTWLSDAIQNNQGRITAFAQRGYDAFKRLMGVLVDFGKGFFNIGRLSMDMARNMGGGIEDIAAKFRMWTESAGGQAKIKKFFDDMQPVLDSVGRLIKAVAIEFGKLASTQGGNLTGLIDKLTGMVPTLGSLADQAGGEFLPNLVKIADAVLRIVDNMNAMGPMSVLMSAVAEPTEILADAFERLPGPVQQAIGYIVMFGIAIHAMAGTAAGAWILQTLGLTAWGNYFKLVIASNIATLKAWVAAQWAAARQSALASKVGMLWGAVGRGIKAATLAMWGFARATMVFLFTNPIGLIIVAVVALVGLFILLWKKSETFRNVVKSIGQWFVNVWNNQIYPLVAKTWEWMKGVWDKIYAFIKGVVSGIVNWFRSNWDTIKTVATTVFNVIKTVVGVVFKAIQTYVKVYITVWKTVFMVAWNIVKFVFNAIVAVVKVFIAIVKPIIFVLAAVFKVVFMVIKAVATVVWSVLRIGFYLFVAAFKIGLLVMKSVFMVVWNIIKIGFKVGMAVMRVAITVFLTVWRAIWNAIKFVFLAVWNAIKAVINFFAPFVIAIFNRVRAAWAVVWAVIRTIVGVAIGIIQGIIQRIVAIVQAVMGVVRGVWSSVWNTLSGIVGGVIDAVTGIINRIRSTVTSVMNVVKGAFTNAFNSIRNFVNPILEKISSFINGIKDAATGLADKVGGLVSMIPGFYAGGTPVVGQRSMVGELGPEAFVTHTGKVSMVGMNGPEVRSFHTPGYVVPNHVLRGGQDSSVPNDVMAKLGAAVGGASGGYGDAGRVYDRAPRTNLSSNDYMSEDAGGGGSHYDFRGASFGGNPADVKAAVKAAIEEAERERKRRG